ncbi:uncharacterized protein KY384_006810 [Bacidia gigantensis]|uniref:uncharacterized protein n=1 Tax=Bacidia gigantensis TaxID=2732470 RepID=UPI001D03B7C4|nr:uncharacterized protein KY384_006810 [Bacidia gigantensis]KAG8527894.1 hypothetical protein KY384_006810 [Bacidia gigantensis]
MANKAPALSNNKNSKLLLDGLQNPYNLYIRDSKLSGAGSGLFAGKEVPAGSEIFRVDDCQKMALKRYHKNECKLYKKMNDPTINGGNPRVKELNTTNRMLIRLVSMYEHKDITTKQWQAFQHLQYHKEAVKQASQADLASIKRNLEINKSLTSHDLTVEELEGIYWRIIFNQQAKRQMPDTLLGRYVVPAAAMINHSCRVNAHPVSDGAAIILRSTHLIMKDEEITRSYCAETYTYKQRQNRLLKAYAFNCRCPRCLMDEKDDLKHMTSDLRQEDTLQAVKMEIEIYITALMNNRPSFLSTSDIETRCKQLCNISETAKWWPIDLDPIPALLLGLAARFEAEGQWKRALGLRFKIVYLINPIRFRDRLNPFRLSQEFDLIQLERRICQLMKTDTDVQTSFKSVKSAIDWVLYGHILILLGDTQESFGVNHVFHKILRHLDQQFVDAKLRDSGMKESQWYSMQVTNEHKVLQDKSEDVLLKWLGIDLGDNFF